MNRNPGKISVIGLGYVGLPLGVALADHFPCAGFDIDKERIRTLKEGHDWTNEVDDERLKKSKLEVSDDPEIMVGSHIFIITTPTPIDDNNQPDLGPVLSACREVAPYLSKGSVVVLESTVYPGVTENECGPVLEKGSGLKAGEDFYLGYSPERINPGDKEHTVWSIPKVVSGQTPEVADLLAEMYGKITKGGIYKAACIKTAEAAKVIENAQRDINIAFVNEAAIIFKRAGISVYDVLEAAGTKWNFLNFKPGLVGGHCIGVDPYYLAHFAEEVHTGSDLILTARKTNNAMAAFIAGDIASHLKKGAKILALGLTFKEDVPDLRNSKAVDLIESLKQGGFDVDVYDPEADPDDVKREYGLDLCHDPRTNGSKYDCVIAIVAHKAFRDYEGGDFSRFLNPGALIADVKGIWRKKNFPKDYRRWIL